MAVRKVLKLYLFLPLIVILCSFEFYRLNSVDENYSFLFVANYRLESQIDSMDENSSYTDYWRLYIGDGMSLFTSLRFLSMDSIKRIESEKGNPYGPSMDWYMNHGTKNTLVVFKNYHSQTITTHDKLAPIISEHYVYEESSPIEWELLEDTTSIGSLTCFAATTTFGGRKWTAWYAPEIPVPDGPFKFKGLPGLVIRIADSTGTWEYELVDFKKEANQFAFNCSDAEHISVTKREFFKQKRNFYDNRIAIMKTMGYTFTDEREARKLHSKDNNWIELHP